ncbi:TonB-dependent receptor [Labilithrix luteola]|uniref:TonB-dependent receptor n=1 Tax=Labilithrix luteola TaxID=1391654 RepID=A0A0K1PMY7_9BACT|nr:PEGA domain-containing protein [Labilithrix luteola]AKU94751.1 TonB-dependent receptor [Labilithrix luteola]
MKLSLSLVGIALFVACSAHEARADDDADRARSAFTEGTVLVEKAQWAEALTAFERARAVRKHPVTTFNMAACERAMGHYTRARQLYLEALAEHEGGAKEHRLLPASLVSEAHAILGELDRMLVRFKLTVEPAESTLAIDGRPLFPSGTDLVAGIRSPGPGEPAPRGTFTVVLDPGLHILMFSRRGFRDTTVSRSFSAGESGSLNFELSRLPATIKISASEPSALVAVNGVDVGPAPVDVLRPAGLYRVLVRRDGFVPYESQVTVEAGQEAAMRATLRRETPSVFSRWWFWTAAGCVVASAAATTYFLTRPEPTRPDVGGGTLGWKAEVK